MIIKIGLVLYAAILCVAIAILFQFQFSTTEKDETGSGVMVFNPPLTTKLTGFINDEGAGNPGALYVASPILSMSQFVPDCSSASWNERCSSTLKTCVGSTSSGEGCYHVGDSCETCYRGDLGYGVPVTRGPLKSNETAGRIVFIPRYRLPGYRVFVYRGWQLSVLGALAEYKQVSLGDIIVLIDGRRITARALRTLAVDPKRSEYYIGLWKPRTGRYVTVRIKR